MQKRTHLLRNTCESDNKIGHYTLDSVKNTISERTQVISPRPNEKFLDVSAMAPIDPRSGWSGSDFSLLPKAYVMVVMENNKNNYLKKETDPLGRVTQYEYTSRSDLKKIIRPDNNDDDSNPTSRPSRFPA